MAEYVKFYGEISQKLVFIGRMVLEWREREHKDVDREVLGGVNAQKALRKCGLYKFWNLGV